VYVFSVVGFLTPLSSCFYCTIFYFSCLVRNK